MTDRVERLREVLGNRYAIEREISSGGMGAVYFGRDLRHDRPVAIKVLHPELATAVGTERFLQEIKLAAGLQHPHILPLYDSGETEDSLFYVMPFAEGESLRARMTRERQLPVNEAVRIAREVCDALDYAHRHGIVHRDIKPENIMLSGTHAMVADFGVARAIHRLAGEHMTGTGLTIGTPTYMSPEQASGEHDLDGRSDIYSLASVVYEMLAGVPPYRGATAQAVIAQRFSSMPTKLSELRPSVPVNVERAIERALAPVPADRFETAARFREALEVPEALSGRPRWRAGRQRRWVTVAGSMALLAAAVVAVLLILIRPALSPGATLDASLYAVLPFQHHGDAAPDMLSGDNCRIHLHDALARWDGVRLVNDLVVNDVRGRNGGSPASLREALETARRLGAGLLVWGEVRELSGIVTVRAALYNVAQRGRVVREVRVQIASDQSDVAEKITALADSLLLERSDVLADSGVSGTNSLKARQAYERGHMALAKWDLALAEQAFREATQADAGYANAHYWLAQVVAWQDNRPRSEWRGDASRAAALGARLPGNKQLAATALLLLAEGRFVDACDKYRDMLGRDSLDFTAWFGLGDCQAHDRLVVVDRASPSGYRFRTSLHSAIHAYTRALDIMPSFHQALRGAAFSRLSSRILYTEDNLSRSGYMVGSDTIWFAAFPALDHDTLAFVPHFQRDEFAGITGPDPASHRAAVARNTLELTRITADWVRAFPNSPDATEGHAVALEALGRIGEGTQGQITAIDATRRARGLASESEQRIRLAAAEARLLVKQDSFASAIQIVDSLLKAVQEPTAREAALLAPLAAFAGRGHLAARLFSRSASEQQFWTPRGDVATVPPAIAEAALTLLAYSSLGSPRDSITLIPKRIESLISAWVAPGARVGVRNIVIQEAYSLAMREVGPKALLGVSSEGHYLLAMQHDLARGDTAKARSAFERLRQVRTRVAAGHVSYDGPYHEAVLLLSIGDTSQATLWLSSALNALPGSRADLLGSVPQSAALVRAMALRAELAARAGDPATAARWARPVTVLWAEADPELQPVVTRMRAVLGQSGGT